MTTLSRFIEPLGWTLLHFLWQGAAVALLLAAFLQLARRCGAATRYAAASVALLLMVLAAVVTLFRYAPGSGIAEVAAEDRALSSAGIVPRSVAPGSVSPAGDITPQAPLVPVLSPLLEEPGGAAVNPKTAAHAAAEAPAERLAIRLRPALPWMVALWAAGVAIFSLRLAFAWRTVRRWRRSDTEALPGIWADRLASLCGKLGITRPVRVLSSAVLSVPVVIGWLRPVVLIPAGLFSGIPAAQLEAILAHELAHVRRHDYLINLLQSVAETLFFYHPAVWWVSAQMRRERENCCDDIAASLHGDPVGYARALASLEELRSMPVAGVSAAGGSLLQRIRRLTVKPEPRTAGVAWPLGILAFIAIGSLVPYTLLRAGETGQGTAAPPAKPAEPPHVPDASAEDAAKRLQTELDIAVPASDPKNAAKTVHEIIISVSTDGSLRYDGDAITREELPKRLAALAAKNRKQALIIRGDAGVPYAEIVNILDATRKAGLFHVSFATVTEKSGSMPSDTSPAGAPPPGESSPPSISGGGTDGTPTLPAHQMADAVTVSGPPDRKTYQHKDGSRTESVTDVEKGEIRETLVAPSGQVTAKRVFYLDKQGRIRHASLFDGAMAPIGSILFGYDKSSGRIAEEQQYNKDGKLIRRIFYPGALKDPKYADKFVAFSIDPNDPKNKEQFAVPNLEAGDDDSTPESTSPSANSPVVVALGTDGVICLDGLKITPEELRGRLQRVPVAQKGNTLLIEIDPEVEMDSVSKIAELIRGAGYKETTISVKQLGNPRVSAADSLLRRARALALAGDGREARETLHRVIELLGSRNGADFLPDYCLPLGDAWAAMASLDAALAVGPENSREIRTRHLAAAFSSSTESLNAYLQFDRINARSVPCRERMAIGYTEMGRLLSLQGRMVDALAACGEAIRLYVELKAENPGNPDYSIKVLSVEYQSIRARLDLVRSKDPAGRQKDLKAQLPKLQAHLLGLRDFLRSYPGDFQAMLLHARATLTSAEVQWDCGNVPEARAEHAAAAALITELRAVPAPSVERRRELNEFTTRLSASSAADPKWSKSSGAEAVDPEVRVLLHSISLPEKTDTSSVQQQRALIDDLRQKLVDGADFAALARQHSRDSKQEKGGEWGWVGPHDLSSAFAPAVFALPKGLSPVISIGGIYYLFRIDDIQTRTSLEVERHYDRSAALFDLGQYAQARAEVDSALELDAANAAAIQLRDRIGAAMVPAKPESGSPAATPPAPAPVDAGAITLTVTDATGKVPLQNFRVIAGVKPGSVGGKDVINWQPHTLRSGKNGALIWPLEGAYDEMALRIEADGCLPLIYTWIDTKKGSQELFLQMTASEGFPALVLTPDGKPASGATVALAMVQRDAVLDGAVLRAPAPGAAEKPSDQWRRPRICTTGADGRCMLPPENDPTAALLVMHDSGVREISLADFLAGRDGAVASGAMAWQVKLQPWATIKGTVTWGDKAAANQQVSLTVFRDTYGYPGIISQYARAVTGQDGSFTFDKVLPGLAQLSCPIVTGAKPAEVTLPGRLLHTTLASGENNVIIGGHGRPVKGKLTGRTDWTGVTFHFHPTAPHIGMPGDDTLWNAWTEFQKSPEGALYFRHGLKVNADGTFEAPAVLPGDYQIFFKRDGEDKYLASGKFSVAPEPAGKADPATVDAGDFKATP